MLANYTDYTEYYTPSKNTYVFIARKRHKSALRTIVLRMTRRICTLQFLLGISVFLGSVAACFIVPEDATGFLFSAFIGLVAMFSKNDR